MNAREELTRLLMESYDRGVKDAQQAAIAAIEQAYDVGVAAERKVIMDSLQKQADLATDALDRRWALEMIAAVAARGETK